MEKINIEKLEKVKLEIRAVVDYHILTAAKFLNDLHNIEDSIKEMQNGL